MKLTTHVVWLPVALAALGCHKATNISDTSGPPTITRDQTLPLCDQAGAPGAHGPAMRHVGRLDGSCFWMDATEVKVGDYAQFLATTPVDAANVTECAGLNPSFDSTATVPSDLSLPVGGVDWCDAAAFCKWAGKRLCGAYTVNAAEQSEYVTTCENGGNTASNWGNFVDPSVCQGGAKTAAVDVGTKADCVTETMVYDLVGNVREWTAECTGTGDTATCEARGGSYVSKSSDWGCSSARALARTKTLDDLGVRCCAD